MVLQPSALTQSYSGGPAETGSDVQEHIVVTQRIDIHQEQDLIAWARTMNTTPNRLKEAVLAAGDKPEDVLAYLSKTTRRGRVAWLPGDPQRTAATTAPSRRY